MFCSLTLLNNNTVYSHQSNYLNTHTHTHTHTHTLIIIIIRIPECHLDFCYEVSPNDKTIHPYICSSILGNCSMRNLSLCLFCALLFYEILNIVCKHRPSVFLLIWIRNVVVSVALQPLWTCLF